MKTTIDIDDNLQVIKNKTGLTWSALIRLGGRWISERREDNDRFKAIEERLDKYEKRMQAFHKILTEEQK